MTRSRLRLSRTLCCAGLLWFPGCDDGHNVVGDEGCYGEHTKCESDVVPLGFVEPSVETAAFEVVASRSLSPSWSNDIACEPSCWLWQMAPAPAGDVWLTVGRLSTSFLERVDALGRPVSSQDLGTKPFYAAEKLSVDEDLNPVVPAWPQGQARGFMRLDGTQPVNVPLPDFPVGLGFFLAGPAGGVRTHVLSDTSSAVYEFDRAGQLIWKQSNLRDPAPDVYSSQAQASINGNERAASLSDGGLAFLLRRRAGPASPAGIAGDFWGITALDAQGNLRWDAYVGSGGHGEMVHLLREWKDSGVAVTSATSNFVSVYALNENGIGQAGWVGQRRGFYGVTPLAMSVDSAGDIYLALVSGEHGAGVLTLCRIHGTNPKAPVDCAALDGLDPFTLTVGVDPTAVVGGPGSASFVGMVATAPGAVVLAMSRVNEEGHGPTTRLFRIDFE